MASGERSRVLVVGLDGGTFDLIRPWVAEGRLPTFRRLLSEAFSHDLKVELPPGTVPNWPSFMTGKNPGKHGLVHWLKRGDGEGLGDLTLVDARDLEGQTIWDTLARRGRRSIVVNVPVTYPPREINGLLVTGLLTPPSARSYTFPESLAAVVENLGYKVFPDTCWTGRNAGDYLRSLHAVADARLTTCLHLMTENDWDFFMVVFSCTDHAGHYFWKYLDPDHPLYDSNAPLDVRDGLLSIYRHMDAALQRFVERLDDRTTLVVMSDHGMGPLHHLSHVNNWLLANGMITLKAAPLSRLKLALFRAGLTPQNVYRLASFFGLNRYRRRADPRRSGRGALLRKLFLSVRDIDWPRTKAYAFGGMGQVFVNERGRYPEGAVRPGEEYDDVARELRVGLQGIRYPPTGEQYIAKVHARDELYWGARASWLPDIVLEPHDWRCSDSGLFEFFSNHLFDTASGVSGAHRPTGICLICGNKTRVGSGRVNLDVRITDLAPTILYLLGEPVPSDMDGRVVEEAISDGYLPMHPVEYADPLIAPGQGGDALSVAEQRELVARLKSLGYLS